MNEGFFHTLIKRASFAAILLAAQTIYAQAPCTLETRGKDVVLSNGIVTASLDVSGAAVNSIKYAGHEMVSNSGRHKQIYFSRDGGASYEHPDHCVGKVTSQSADLVDYSCKHTYTPADGDKAAWDVDVHYVVKHGVPGVYVYADTVHHASYPNLGVGEWRMVWSPSDEKADFLDTIYIDEARHWKIPGPGDFASAQPVNGPKEVTLLTTGLWKGRMDCKYMYAASYWEIGTWGFASSDKHLGSFVVLPSKEFFNDGPNKQDLTAAVGTTLLHLNMNHYDGTGIEIKSGREWSKFYGPWLLYFNSKSSADECWRDAQQRVNVEAAKWPYDWVKNSDYPLAAQRGTVRGQLVVHDPLKPNLTAENAWVGVSPPGEPPKSDFQYEASAYQFWTHAAADGQFTLTNVRPGNYTLYAFTNGIVGQFEKANIVVKAGGVISLGNIAWDVVHPGRQIAWEIGVPDRSAAEFGHGRDYYLPLLYQKLAVETPDPLEYTIGTSDPSKDWIYAQTHHGPSGHATAAKWNIHFNLATAPSGLATLTLAFAGAERARIGVEVNNAKVSTVTPPIQGGNGLIREAVHAKYSVSYVTIPTGHLHAGANTISLTQESVREESSYVMYDYLNLELP